MAKFNKYPPIGTPQPDDSFLIWNNNKVARVGYNNFYNAYHPVKWTKRTSPIKPGDSVKTICSDLGGRAHFVRFNTDGFHVADWNGSVWSHRPIYIPYMQRAEDQLVTVYDIDIASPGYEFSAAYMTNRPSTSAKSALTQLGISYNSVSFVWNQGWNGVSSSFIPERERFAKISRNGNIGAYTSEFSNNRRIGVMEYLGLGSGIFSRPTIEDDDLTQYEIKDMDMSPDGNVVCAILANGGIKLWTWNGATWSTNHIPSFIGFTGPIAKGSVSLSDLNVNQERTLSATTSNEDGLVLVFTLSNDSAQYRTARFNLSGPVIGAKVSADGSSILVSGVNDLGTRIYRSLTNGWRSHTGPPTILEPSSMKNLSISTDGKTIAVANDTDAQVWDVDF